jgi:SAM-dependent methyltransferase
MSNDKFLVNIACGDAYVDGWINFDHSPVASSIVKVNLLKGIPCSDGCVDVAYSSHFLEHIPRHKVNYFLSECFRILKQNGVLRLVLPDFEEMAKSYITYRESKSHQEADFLMLEIFDQMVRTAPGGELGCYYTQLKERDPKMISFVRERTGFRVGFDRKGVSWRDRIYQIKKNPISIFHFFEKAYIKFILALLPSAFKDQNVSLATLGERHAWMYDYHVVRQLLISVGFKNVKRYSAVTSSIHDFPFYPLDVDENGNFRKGAESMYIEAIKI